MILPVAGCELVAGSGQSGGSSDGVFVFRGSTPFVPSKVEMCSSTSLPRSRGLFLPKREVTLNDEKEEARLVKFFNANESCRRFFLEGWFASQGFPFLLLEKQAEQEKKEKEEQEKKEKEEQEKKEKEEQEKKERGE